MRFASSIRSCLRGPELGLGLRHIAHNIVKHTIVIEYRPAIGRRYSLFVHNMGGGLNCASKVFWILSSICNLQFAVVLAVSNIIWVKTSSCCEFILVVMGTMCILYADLTLTQIFSEKSVIVWLSPHGRANNWRSNYSVEVQCFLCCLNRCDFVIVNNVCFGFKLFLQKRRRIPIHFNFNDKTDEYRVQLT